MNVSFNLTEEEVKDLINTQAINASLRATLERYKPATPPPGYMDCGPYTLVKNFTSNPGEQVFNAIIKEVVAATQLEVTKQFKEHLANFEPKVTIDYAKLVLDIHSRYGFFPPKETK